MKNPPLVNGDGQDGGPDERQAATGLPSSLLSEDTAAMAATLSRAFPCAGQ
jgi:hypothetical protein